MPDLLIHNVNVFDSLTGTLDSDRSVLVRESTIEWIGPSASAPSPEGAQVVNGEGKTLLPGFINSHVHLMADSDPDDPFTTDLEWAVARAIVAAETSLRTGVTTVRDCGSLNGLAIKVAAMVESGFVPGPRIHAAGHVITMTGGHCHFIGRQVNGPWAITEAVRQELHAGAHFIKIMATGGVLTKGSSPEHISFEAEELAQAARITHNAGKRITSHAIGAAGVKNAIRAGIDSIEHACYIDDEVIELALDNQTYIVPTLNAVEGEAANVHTLAEWMRGKIGDLAEASESGFRRLVDAGVNIAAGSDAGTPFNTHADFPQELVMMVRYGMSPAQALMAATRGSAVNLGIEDTVGTVKEGMGADLILVEGDPTADIKAIFDLSMVVANGKALML